LLASQAGAQGGPVTFLKVGKAYEVYLEDPEHKDFGKFRARVKLLEAGGGQWFRVRVFFRWDELDGLDDAKSTQWLNFDHVRMVFEYKEEEPAAQKKQ
jgi:hypothetical protein